MGRPSPTPHMREPPRSEPCSGQSCTLGGGALLVAPLRLHAPHCRAPTRRFIHDWVYSGVFRDAYGEFMIQVNHEYLGFRGRWLLAGPLPSGSGPGPVRDHSQLRVLSHMQTSSTGPTATCSFPRR